MAAPQMVIKIVGDVAGLQAALARGEAAVTALGPSVAKLAATWKTHSDKLVTDAANVTAAVAQIGAKTLTAADSASALKKLEAAMAQLRASGQPIPPLMAQTASQLHALHPAATTAASGLTAVKTLLGSLGLTLGVGALVLGVKRFVSSLFEMGDSLTKLHSRSGIAIEDLQVLGTVAMRGGTDLETLIGAINMMQKRVAGDDDSAVRALRFLKIDIAALQTLTPDQWFYTVSKAINAVGDAALRTKLRTDIMGRGASEVADAMVQDFEAAREATVKMSAGTAIALDNAGEKLSLWVRNLKVWTVGVVVALYDQCVRIVDIALITLDKMLAGFYGKWAVFLGSIAQSGVLGPTVSGVLYSKAAEASWLSTFYTDTAKAHEAALEREAVAALSAAAGTGKASASLDGLSKAGEKAAAEVAKIRDHMYGRDAMKQLETWGAAIGDLNKIAGLAPAIQDEWRAAVEKAEKALGKMTPELKKLADAIPLVSRAIELSQMTRAPAGVTGWPGLTSWAASQPGYASVSSSGIPPLPSTDLSGMLWSLPGGYAGNMQAGQLVADQRGSIQTVSELSAALDDLSRSFAQLAQISDGAMGKVMSAVGQGVASLSLMLRGMETFSKGQAAMDAATTSADKWTAGMQMAAGAASYLSAITQAYDQWLAQSEAQDKAAAAARLGIDSMITSYLRASGGVEQLTAKLKLLGVEWSTFEANMRRAGTTTEHATKSFEWLTGLLDKLQARQQAAQTAVSLTAGLVGTWVESIRKGSETGTLGDVVTGAQARFSALAAYTIASFAAMVKTTGDFAGSLQALGPTLDGLIEAQTTLGLTAGGAIGELLKIRSVQAEFQALLGPLNTAAAIVRSLKDAGVISAETMQALGRDTLVAFEAILAKGYGAQMAMVQLQGPLQTLWESWQEGKVAIDEATIALLKQAETAGLVGANQQSVNDRLIASFGELKLAIDSLIIALQDLGTGALKWPTATTAGAATTEASKIKPLKRSWWDWLQGAATGVFFHEGGLITRAHAGASFWPAGEALIRAHEGLRVTERLRREDVPIIARVGEGILSHDVGMPALGAWALDLLNRGTVTPGREGPLPVGAPVPLAPVSMPMSRGPVMTSPSSVHITIHAWDAASVETWLRRGGARQLAEATVPEIPGAVKRYGLT